jgi:hypothetical protein
MNRKIQIVALLATLVIAGSAAAQEPEPIPLPGVGMGGAAVQTRGGMLAMHFGMDAAPVKGAPFCATVLTEHTQSLADGNRIHTSDSSVLCRDGEGRIRREAGLNLLGASRTSSTPKLITIMDPVAGVRYLLDTENKVAQKMPLLPGRGPAAAEAGAPPAPGKQVMIYQRTGGAGSDVAYNEMMVKKVGPDSAEAPPTSENLGDQTMDGIHVTGTRVTTTIPAGKVGNEKPITVTSERWYSPELKATVVTKHEDPLAGELKTELKNVNTAEPDASLFSVPADYKIVDEKEGPIKIRLRAPDPPPQQ